MSPPPINVLIVGTGMYVCGRGADGYGTILPAVLQARRRGLVGELLVASRRAEAFSDFDRRIGELARNLDVDGRYTAYAKGHDGDDDAYRTALRKLPSPAAVIICTPDHLHAQMAVDAADAGKPFLVVKPLTPTLAEAQQVLEATKRNNVHGAVEFHKRWDWANLQIRQRLQAGEFGKPLYFKIEYSQRKSIPSQLFRAWVDQTNIFQYLAVHYVDLIYFMTGARPRRVSAIGQKSWLISQGIDNFDAVQATVEWEDGFSSVFLVNWIDPESSPAMSQQKIDIVGTLGRLQSDQVDRGTAVWSEKGVALVNPYFCQTYQAPGDSHRSYRGYGIESVTSFLEDAFHLAAGKVTAAELEYIRPSIRSALVSTSVVEAVNQSLATNGAWVTCA